MGFILFDLLGIKIGVGNSSSIKTRGCQVWVNGKQVEGDFSQSDELHITLEGTVASIDAGGSVECQNVQGNIDAGGSIQCRDVGGSIDAGGSVQCGDVTGSIDAGGSVNHG